MRETVISISKRAATKFKIDLLTLKADINSVFQVLHKKAANSHFKSNAPGSQTSVTLHAYEQQ